MMAYMPQICAQDFSNAEDNTHVTRTADAGHGALTKKIWSKVQKRLKENGATLPKDIWCSAR
jgi:hypothetical protein